MIDQLILVNSKFLTMMRPVIFNAFAAILANVNTEIQDNKVIKFVFILVTSIQISIFPSDVGTYFRSNDIGMFISHQLSRIVSSQQLDFNIQHHRYWRLRWLSLLFIYCLIQFTVIMLLRTWALWERSRAVLIFLGVFSVVRSNLVYINIRLVILIKLRSAYWLLRDQFCTFHSPCSVSRLLAVTTVHLISPPAIPKIGAISPCNVAFPRPDLLYGIWVSLCVFDSGKLLVLLQQHEFDSPNC